MKSRDHIDNIHEKFQMNIKIIQINKKNSSCEHKNSSNEHKNIVQMN